MNLESGIRDLESAPRAARRHRRAPGARGRVAPGAIIPILLALLVGPAASRADGPIPARVDVPAGPYYVGQAIDVRVVVVAAGERPAIRGPGVEGAEVLAAAAELRPVASGAIGDVMTETNRYLYHFWVIPHRAGPVRIPAFTVRLGDRSGATAPRSIDVRPVPREGRTSAFLGGVGPLSVSAEARPATLRVGQELEYRLTLSGPAALGSTRRPELAGLGRSGLAPRVEPLDDEVSAVPPERVFRWRVRPTRPGETRLPAVPIARFEPRLRRYLTVLAPSVPVRVVDVPTLDPARLEYAVPDRNRSRPPAGPVVAGVLALAVASGGLIAARVRSRRLPRRPDPRRLARRLADDLGKPDDRPDDLARRIAEGLAAYLHLAAGRPPGALTPDEARHWVSAVSARPDLGDRAARLIAGCDRVRFAETAPTGGVRDGAALFGELARVKIRRAGGWPREALGIADKGRAIASCASQVTMRTR